MAILVMATGVWNLRGEGEGAIKQSERVALITGASYGLGLEVARLFARQRMRLGLTARGAEALQEAVDEGLAPGAARGDRQSRAPREGLPSGPRGRLPVARVRGPAPDPAVRGVSAQAV